VIDVNIPELITTDLGDQPSSYLKPNNEEAQKQAEKLAAYLWENYIEPSEAESLYFMGVGNAFHGIVKLLCDKGKQPRRCRLAQLINNFLPQKAYISASPELSFSLRTILSAPSTVMKTHGYRNGTAKTAMSSSPIHTPCGQKPTGRGRAATEKWKDRLVRRSTKC